MKHIIESAGIVAQGIATAILTGVLVGAFFGSAYTAFRWMVD